MFIDIDRKFEDILKLLVCAGNNNSNATEKLCMAIDKSNGHIKKSLTTKNKKSVDARN